MEFNTIYNLTGIKPKVKAENGNILGIRPRRNWKRFSFVVRHLEWYSNPKGHISSIIFPDVDFKTIRGEFRTPVKEHVLIKCSCPAFLYYGSEYYASQFGYHIDGNTENRPPVIRDPEGNRYLCKHLIRVYKYLEKISFDKLMKRFKVASTSELKLAKLEDDIIPAFVDYLIRMKTPEEQIHKIISSLNYQNCEEILEQFGVLIMESPHKLDIPRQNAGSGIKNLFEKEMLK